MNRFRRLAFTLIVVTLCFSSTSAASAAAWPASPTGTSIGTDLTSLEISGVVWDNFTGKLYTVDDEGKLIRTERDGSDTTIWPVVYVPGPAKPTTSAPTDLRPQLVVWTGTKP